MAWTLVERVHRLKRDELASLRDKFEALEPDAQEAALREVLTPREEQILRLRCGLGHLPHTLAKVGALFEVTPEAIRYYEKRAFVKLRDAGVLA